MLSCWIKVLDHPLAIFFVIPSRYLKLLVSGERWSVLLTAEAAGVSPTTSLFAYTESQPCSASPDLAMKRSWNRSHTLDCLGLGFCDIGRIDSRATVGPGMYIRRVSSATLDRNTESNARTLTYCSKTTALAEESKSKVSVLKNSTQKVNLPPIDRKKSRTVS